MIKLIMVSKYHLDMINKREVSLGETIGRIVDSFFSLVSFKLSRLDSTLKLTQEE